MRMETTTAGRRIIAEEDFTAEHVAGLRDLLAEWLPIPPDSLLLEMEAVKAMDGRGLALLAGLAASCRHHSIPLRLAAVRPDLQQLLKLCRFPGSVEIIDTAADG